MTKIATRGKRVKLLIYDSGIFLPFRSRGQGPVEFGKKSILTIKIGKI